MNCSVTWSIRINQDKSKSIIGLFLFLFFKDPLSLSPARQNIVQFLYYLQAQCTSPDLRMDGTF